MAAPGRNGDPSACDDGQFDDAEEEISTSSLVALGSVLKVCPVKQTSVVTSASTSTAAPRAQSTVLAPADQPRHVEKHDVTHEPPHDGTDDDVILKKSSVTDVPRVVEEWPALPPAAAHVQSDQVIAPLSRPTTGKPAWGKPAAPTTSVTSLLAPVGVPLVGVGVSEPTSTDGRVDVLVADSVAFLRNVAFEKIGRTVVTVREVRPRSFTGLKFKATFAICQRFLLSETVFTH